MLLKFLEISPSPLPPTPLTGGGGYPPPLPPSDDLAYPNIFILICLGKTLADPSFEMEVNAIKAFLSMQAPAQAPAINPASIEINPEDYVAPRFARKIKSKVSTYFIILNSFFMITF